MNFFILIWSLSTLGFFALASSMEKHQKQIFLRPLSPKTTILMTVVGWGLLISTLVLCICSGLLSNMLSYWVGVLTFSALAVGLCLSYWAENSQKIAWLVGIVALVSTFIHFFSSSFSA